MNNIDLKELREKDMISTKHNEYIFDKMNKHLHSYYEIELVLDGEGVHLINDHKYDERPGDVFIMRLNDFHEFQLVRKGDHLVVEIPVKCIPRDIEEFLEYVDGNIFVHMNDEDFNQARTIYNMIDAISKDSGAFEKAQKTYLVSGLIMFILSRLDDNASERYSEANLRLREIISYINKNLKEDLNAKTLSSRFYISKGYLESFFKKRTGVTLNGYIRKLRLEAAQELLINTDKSVTDICEEVGFNSIPTFFRVFKNAYGESPTNIRRRNK